MSRTKKEEVARCPLCSRHCPLTSPHCRKGEKYARSMQKRNTPKPVAPKEPAPMSIDDMLLTQLRLCSQNLRRQYRDGGSRYRILATLIEREKISQHELISILDIKSGSLSELLAKLEKKSLIRRKKNDTDKRNRDIVLTEAGRAWYLEHSEPKRLYAAQLFSELSEDEKSQLSALLTKLLKTGEQSSPVETRSGEESIHVDAERGIESAGSGPDEESAGNDTPEKEGMSTYSQKAEAEADKPAAGE